MKSKPLTMNGHIVKNEGRTPETFADGIHEMYLGSPISRITFYSMDGATDDGREIRTPQQRIVIPTNALLEMCRNILAFATANSEGMKDGYDLQANYFSRLLSDVNITRAPSISDTQNKSNE